MHLNVTMEMDPLLISHIKSSWKWSVYWGFDLGSLLERAVLSTNITVIHIRTLSRGSTTAAVFVCEMAFEWPAMTQIVKHSTNGCICDQLEGGGVSN